jgi:YXWGXW repeat-containing protein/thrombospondin type 3 repeat protein
MFMKKILISALVAAGMIGAVAAPLPVAAATGSVEIYVNSPPPPPRHEYVPEPRRGYVWVPGHWRWSDGRHRYVWEQGHWERARPGYTYYEPRWVERNGRWHYQPSRWDRDGDGIPNRRDRTPDGAGPSWDRDNDGIPNRRDPTPDGEVRRPRDTDRDGVPDRFDNYPNDPRWR